VPVLIGVSNDYDLSRWVGDKKELSRAGHKKRH